jgi:hypothetical protein
MRNKIRRGHKAAKRLHKKLHRLSRHAMKKTFVTLGDLVSAAYEVSGSADAAALLLSPLSPLSHLLGRRIVVASS